MLYIRYHSFNFFSLSLDPFLLPSSALLPAGFRRFLSNIKEMGVYIPAPLKAYWLVTWIFITPVLLVVSSVGRVWRLERSFCGRGLSER